MDNSIFKPCPVCKEQYKFGVTCEFDRSYIYCLSCKHRGPYTLKYDFSRDSVISQWNSDAINLSNFSLFREACPYCKSFCHREFLIKDVTSNKLTNFLNYFKCEKCVYASKPVADFTDALMTHNLIVRIIKAEQI